MVALLDVGVMAVACQKCAERGEKSVDKFVRMCQGATLAPRAWQASGFAEKEP